MKVLFINHVPLTGTGSGVYTTNLANSLTKKGNDVAIIFPENRRKYELYENIKLYPVFFKNKDIIETENQLDMNFPCFTTHPRSTFNFRDMTQQQRKDYEEVFFEKINEVINEFKPDIVHAQHVWTLSGVAAECCKTRQIPMVITCHGTDLMAIDDEQKRNENWGTNWAIKAVEYAKAIITISKDSNILLESMLPETKGKTIKIRNGVNSNIFFIDKSINKKEVLKSLGVEKEYNKVVCFAGKLAEFKGVDVLLDAAKKYETNDIVTLISGDGKLRKDLKEQANRLNLKNVKFLGNQPQDKLREIYNIADCSCVPSRREPFGLVAIEAISCGTPVVATNEGGLPDFITPDVGILIPVDDANKLADAIISILDSKVKFDGEKIAKKIKENYSQDVLIDKFIEIYKK